MTKELKVFTNEEIRSTEIDGMTWFVAADVCKSLDIQNTTQAVAKLDEDEKSMLNIGLTGGVNPRMLNKLIEHAELHYEECEDW